MIRKVILYPLFLIIAVLLYMVLGKADIDSFDDLGLFAVDHVQEAENGYLKVAYLYTDNFQVFSREERAKVKQYLELKNWNQNSVGNLLQEKRQIIDDVAAAAAMPGYQMPAWQSVDGVYPLVPTRDIVHLLILQFLFYTHEGNNQDALNSMAVAVAFVEHNRSGTNAYLVHYFLANAMHQLLLEKLHWMLSSGVLDTADYQFISDILHKIPDYRNDGFNRVVAAEYRFSALFVRDMADASFSENWQHYWDSVDAGYSTEPVSDFFTLLSFSSVQPNRVLAEAARDYQNLQVQADSYCVDINLHRDSPGRLAIFHGLTWSSYSMIKVNREVFMPAYLTYFEKRCLFSVYVDALKTIAAMQYFRSVMGSYPASPDLLVPDYLDRMPVDYFSGEALMYSQENEWFYSAGNNYQFEGGLKEGFNWTACSRDERCMQEPTVPVIFELD